MKICEIMICFLKLLIVWLAIVKVGTAFFLAFVFLSFILVDSSIALSVLNKPLADLNLTYYPFIYIILSNAVLISVMWVVWQYELRKVKEEVRK